MTTHPVDRSSGVDRSGECQDPGVDALGDAGRADIFRDLIDTFRGAATVLPLHPVVRVASLVANMILLEETETRFFAPIPGHSDLSYRLDATGALHIVRLHSDGEEEILTSPRERVDDLTSVYRNGAGQIVAVDHGGALQIDLDVLPGPPVQVLEPTDRTSSIHRALSASSNRAWRILGALNNRQNWQAHHLIPFNVVERGSPALQAAFLRAAAAGWRMDSAENLIPLPADMVTYGAPPNSGVLPYHSGPHGNYDAIVRRELARLESQHASMTDAQIRAELARVEAALRLELVSNRAQLHPRLN
jgi:hypothetical protein